QQQYFNNDDEYAGIFTWQSNTRPRHRMTMSGVYELPFGHGRHFLSRAPSAAEAIIGGWTTTAVYTYNSGDLLQFGQVDVVGNQNIDNPSKWGLRFNPAAFKQSAAFTPRTNPCVKGGVKVDHQGGAKGDHAGEAGCRCRPWELCLSAV